MADNRDSESAERREAVRSLSDVFRLAFPVDRTPFYSRLVRAIDAVDKEQSRRRKRDP